MKTSKGFTIIELLVVIAIIAVLAAVVMVNVTGYINKGKDAAIKANLPQIATTAAIYYDDSTKGNGDFVGLAADANIVAGVAAITNANSAPIIGVTDTTGLHYCAEAALKAGGFWCVDDTGYNGALTATHCATGTPSCK